MHCLNLFCSMFLLAIVNGYSFVQNLTGTSGTASQWYNGILGLTPAVVNQVTSALALSPGTTVVPVATAGPGALLPVTSGSAFTSFSWTSTSASPFTGYNFGRGDGVPVFFEPYITYTHVYLPTVTLLSLLGNRIEFTHAINYAVNASKYADFVFHFNKAVGVNGAYRIWANTSPDTTLYTLITPQTIPGSAISVAEGQWVKLQHRFFEGSGSMLACDMNIYSVPAGMLLGTFPINTALPITSAGGNRYSWFAVSEFTAGSVAADNNELTSSPTGTE